MKYSSCNSTVFVGVASTPVCAITALQKYTVIYFSARNDVEGGLVNDITQNHKNLLWFASWDDLYWFDGYNFKNYISKESVTNNRLLTIEKDEYGYIWMLSYVS